MLLPIIAGILLAPKVLELGNRVLRDYAIPHCEKKAAEKGHFETPVQLGLDVHLTNDELDELDNMGALIVIARGAKRHHDYVNDPKAEGKFMDMCCKECKRLK